MAFIHILGKFILRVAAVDCRTLSTGPGFKPCLGAVLCLRQDIFTPLSIFFYQGSEGSVRT